MSRKRTHEEFINIMRDKHPTITVVGTYVNSTVPVELKCNKCGYEWKTKPPKSLIGHGCPFCGKSLKKTHDQFVRSLSVISPEIEVIGEYVNSQAPILCRCAKGHEWMSRPNDLMQGKSCPKCAHNAKKTHQEFVDDLAKISNRIVAIDQYIGSHNKIRFRCVIDGHIWMASPSNILRGYGCPKCNQSKGEDRIERYLVSRCISFEQQYIFSDCISERALPFDFYIPIHNCAIEYDGEQHFKPVKFGGISIEKAQNEFSKLQSRDAIKNDYCKEHDIKLIRIPYTEFDEIENILDKQLL